MIDKTIVLAGDYSYIRQIETTIKSICFHNKNVKIYLFNEDIPQEWFIQTRLRLSEIGSQLIDLKFNDINKTWQLPKDAPQINYMTYARYFIPNFVTEDIVLYLDTDLVVTADLTEIFETDLTTHPVAAASAAFGLFEDFNAGVMLINNKYWKKENITEQLINLTNSKHDKIGAADQTILNEFFGNNYILLDDRYNFQIGFDRQADQWNKDFIFEFPLDPLPVVVHYLSPDKPWNTHSSGRLRDLWWRYALLDWSEVINSSMPSTKRINKKNLLITTNSQNIEGIETLASALPDYQFHIATFTRMGSYLTSLAKFENITLHPLVMWRTLLNLIETCDAYLDINHGPKFNDIIERVAQAQKSIISFENTKNLVHVDFVFKPHETTAIVQTIKKQELKNNK